MKDTIIYFTIRLISGFIGLASIYILTRILSPEEYGEFALLIAILTFVSGIGYQWLIISTSRLIVEHKTNLPTFFKAVISLFIVSSLFVAILIFISTYIYPKMTEDYYFLLVSIAIILGIYNLLIHLANISQKPFLYGSLSLSRSIVSLLASVIFILYFNWSSIGAIFGFSIGFFISILLFIFYYQSTLLKLYYQIKKLPVMQDDQLVSTLFRYGIPLSFTYLALMLINVSDRLMLAKLGTTIDVAVYSAVYDLSQQTIGVLMNTLFLAYFPKIIYAYTNGLNKQLSNMTQQLGTLMLIIGILVSIIFTNASTGIANIMFGEGIAQPASQIIPIISIGMAIGFYKNFYLDIAFQVMKNTNMQFKLTAIMAGINILANVVLIPIFGSYGAALSTLIAFSLGAILSYIYGNKIMPLFIFTQDSLKIFLSGILTFVLVYYFNFTYTSPIDTLVNIIILSSVFCLFLILFNISNIQRTLYTIIIRK